ncbi:natriuretic peptide A-like [Betta splendens]|uniref:Natriuretic peptide A-like n=1 Tax=Betta splendens TaxID=158456 RepID=A0A6P7N0F3_BETSP|nr:natriuretic peptide A-like [Betta splendens]
MSPNGCVSCFSLLLMLNAVGAKPVSELQALKQLLEEQINAAPFDSSSEAQVRRRDDGAQAAFGTAEEQPWEASEPSHPENVLARLLQDLMRTTKRSWNRHKKGALRSCFGVRLERIGSFSGLGC